MQTREHILLIRKKALEQVAQCDLMLSMLDKEEAPVKPEKEKITSVVIEHFTKTRRNAKRYLPES